MSEVSSDNNEAKSPGEVSIDIPLSSHHLEPPKLIKMPSSSNSSNVTRIFQKEYIYPEWVTKKHYKFFRRLQKRLLKLNH